MATNILHKRNALTGVAPTTGQIALGEIAVNTFDGKLYIKKDDGVESIVEIGTGAGGLFTEDASNNIVGGTDAGIILTGSRNFLSGRSAGTNITLGSDNIGIGTFSMGGNGASPLNGKGANVAIGSYAGQFLESNTANDNLIVGAYAGQNATTGDSNVLLGGSVGSNIITGAGNVLIGFSVGPTVTDVSNKLYIHNAESDTPLIGGDFAAGTVTINGSLDVTGGVNKLSNNTGVVDVSITPAPTVGQILTAISTTRATWQDPVGGGGGSQTPWTSDIDTGGFSLVSTDSVVGTVSPITIQGGNASYAGGGYYSGFVNINGGNGTNGNTGGYINLIGGSSDSYYGGYVRITGGTSTSGQGGYVSLRGGYSTSGQGGGALLRGSNSGTGNAGYASVTGGNTTDGATGGYAAVRAGNGGNTGIGGFATLQGGAGAAGSGGVVTIIGGSSNSAEGGNVTIQAGSTTSGPFTGNITLIGGAGGTTSKGGDIVLQGGVAQATAKVAGDLILSGGGSSDGIGGTVKITGGSDTLATGTGGSITLTPGSNQNGSLNGTVEIHAPVNVGSTSELRIFRDTSSDHSTGFYVGIATSISLASNITLTLPPTLGAAGDVLTDVAGNGVMTFESQSDLGEFTIATLPVASSNANSYALATDASGGRTVVRSDGTNWKVIAVEGATVA